MKGEDTLDARLAQHFRDDAVAHRGIDDTAAARVLARLASPLPPQRQAWRLWPTILLDWTFAPAWPRVAALAVSGVLGFAVGIASPILHQRGHTTVLAMSGDVGIAAMLSEPEPLSGDLP